MMDAKCKNVDNCTQTQLQPGIRVFYAIQKEVTSMQNSQAVKTGVALKSLDLKSCKIKGCSQEVTTKMLRFTRSWLLKLINLKICGCFLAATFDFYNNFHPSFYRPHQLLQLGCFSMLTVMSHEARKEQNESKRPL